MPNLHIQNIYDAINPTGKGVTGYMKVRCCQLENRAPCLAEKGDVIAINNSCPESFVKYISGILGLDDVTVLRHSVSPNLNRRMDSYSVMEGLTLDHNWQSVTKRKLIINPYIRSPALYRAAFARGISIPSETWKTIVETNLTIEMNDKAGLYEWCKELSIHVPDYWIAKGLVMTNIIIDLIKSGHSPLYVRQTRTAGAIGNITIERKGPGYRVRERNLNVLNETELMRILEDFIRSNYWDEFLITDLLDLYCSPATLFYAGEKEISIIAHTYQVLSGNGRFLGSIYPIKDKRVTDHFELAEKSLLKLVEPWRKRGFRGYGNIDWMITSDDKFYVAEMNARQTGALTPLKIAHNLSKPGVSGLISATDFAVISRDDIRLNHAISFDELISLLEDGDLLLGRRGLAEGMIVTIPPTSIHGINSTGIMALSTELSKSRELFDRALEMIDVQPEVFMPLPE